MNIFVNGVNRLCSWLLVCAVLGMSGMAHAQRLMDLVSIQGVRSNQLVGYGLVAGLDGTGDQTVQTPFTVQSLTNMLTSLGITVPASEISTLMLKNVAAVMVTAELPAFSQPGQKIDVTVSSVGNAQSLSGGTLVLTPLKGADGQVYAMAQGNLIVGGEGAAANGSKQVKNHLSVGIITDGATVEKVVGTSFDKGNTVHLELNQMDFATVSRVVDAINRHFGFHAAQAIDGRVIQVQVPLDSNSRVAFLGELQNINVTPSEEGARVVINARTGSVVMNQEVTLDPCAISHGNLTITVTSTPSVSQPNAMANGNTTTTATSQISVQEAPGAVALLRGGANLADVVKALNSVGATPQDLLSILQAMKSAGALHAELEVI